MYWPYVRGSTPGDLSPGKAGRPDSASSATGVDPVPMKHPIDGTLRPGFLLSMPVSSFTEKIFYEENPEMRDCSPAEPNTPRTSVQGSQCSGKPNNSKALLVLED
jgi:hypothetical protein